MLSLQIGLFLVGATYVSVKVSKLIVYTAIATSRSWKAMHSEAGYEDEDE
jgi:hypothetical protein